MQVLPPAKLYRPDTQGTGFEEVETQANPALQGLHGSVGDVVYSPFAQTVQFVASPEEKLPATLKAELVSSSSETLDSFVFDISTAQFSPIKIEIPANRCNLKPKITEHCIIRYELSPSWIYGNYEMGIFLLD